MPSESVAMIVGVFLLAGWVKGVVGMGLPTVAIGALGLTMPPVQAAALLVVPSLVTNVWQFVAGPSAWRIVRRLASMLIFVCAGTAVGIRFLTADPSRLPTIALGACGSLRASRAVPAATLGTIAFRMEFVSNCRRHHRSTHRRYRCVCR